MYDSDLSFRYMHLNRDYIATLGLAAFPLVQEDVPLAEAGAVLQHGGCRAVPLGLEI